MKKQRFTPSLGRVALACILSTSLVAPMATPAIADTIDDLRKVEEDARAAASAAQQRADSARTQQSVLEGQVQEAQARLTELSQEAEVAEYDLISITNELEATKEHIGELDVQIEQTRGDLDVSKSKLAKIVADSYRNGRPTLLSVALNATSFEDLISRIKYANKVAEYETAVINKVKELEARLNQEHAEFEEQQALQEEQQAVQEERVAAAEQAVAAVESYQAQLSAEIQQKISEADAAQRQAAEQSSRADAAQAQRRAEEEARRKAEEEARRKAEEEARRAAEEAARQQAAEEAARQQAAAEAARQQAAEEAARRQAAATQTAEPVQPTTTESPSPSPSSNDTSSESGSSDNGDSSSSSDGGSSYSGSTRSASSASDVASFVANAYSIIGSGYSYSGYYWTGSPSSSVFTCSGVVDYALGRGPRSSSPESLQAEVAAGGGLVYSVSQLNYGDLVFYNCLGRYPGHVGIYIGNGNVIDSIPNGGVAIRDVNYMSVSCGGPIL
jgi:peptidoglycan hydrolase CwlO-like protein